MTAAGDRDDGSDQFVLLGDLPYEGGQDPLGFDELVEDLAALILASRRSSPFTLGVEAAWGMGKSTLMGRLRARLEQEAAITPVQFNAWTADERGVLEGLIKTVLNELDPNALRRSLRNERLVGGLRLALGIAAGFLGLGNAVNAVWDRVADDPSARNELRSLVEQAVGAWRDKRAGPSGERLLCVFVDDLDRCSPEGVLLVFEAMKLYLDVPGIVFVIGYDRDIVSDLVLKRKGYSEEIKARDYLEKFIQIVYRIPRPPAVRSEALLESLLADSDTARLFGDTERSLVIDRSQSNPRRIKRFINGFVLAYGLDSRWRRFDPQSLVRLQLLHMYFEEFAALLEHPSERDPVEEFLTYRAARDALRRGDRSSEAWAHVSAAFKGYRVPVPPRNTEIDPSSLLEGLEEQAPVAFGPLADRGDFASLVESIAGSEDWMLLRRALAEGTLPPISSSTADRSGSHEDGVDSLEGLSVLWVDDDIDRNRRFADELTSLGATVVQVPDERRMRLELGLRPFDVLISDIGRGEDHTAGLDALARLRELDAGLVPPTVIFFAGRVTPARMQRAGELGASMTAAPAAVLERLKLAARERANAGSALEAVSASSED